MSAAHQCASGHSGETSGSGTMRKTASSGTSAAMLAFTLNSAAAGVSHHEDGVLSAHAPSPTPAAASAGARRR